MWHRESFRLFLGMSVLWCGFGASAAHAQKVTTVPVQANSILYDAVSKKLYASVGGGVKDDTANSITVIDPKTGKVGPSVFVGSNPGGMALSDKGKYLYVVVGDGRTVRKIDLATMTPGMQFPVGDGLAIRTIYTLPGNPDGVVVMRFTPGISPSGDHLVVFINGKAQAATSGCGPTFMPGFIPTRVYTYQSMISSWDFTTHQILPDGIKGVANTGGLMSGFVGLAAQANGLIINSSGGVIDPEARQGLGSLQTGPDAALCGDASTMMVYQITGEKDEFKITAHDLLNYKKLGTVTLKNVGASGGPGNLLRWGENGFAFTAGDRVVLTQLELGQKLVPVDLSVKRSTLPAILPREGAMKYTLTVTNNSLAKCTGAFLTDVLPSGVEVSDVKASQGNALASGGIVRAELGPIPAKAKVTVEVTLQMRSPGENGFHAVVRGNEPDSVVENNLATITPGGLASRLPDLTGSWQGLRQFAQGAGVNLRAAIVGTLVIRNSGKQDSSPCVVRFYVSASPGFRAATSQLLQEVEIPGLRRGDNYTVNLQAPLGAGDDATGLFVFGVIDPGNGMEESDKGNNVVRARIP